jgi:hypothetical protein
MYHHRLPGAGDDDQGRATLLPLRTARSTAGSMTSKTQAAPNARDNEKAIAQLQRELRDLQTSRAQAEKVIDRDPGMPELIARLEAKIAEVQGKLRELRGTTAGEQMAELDTKIAGVEAELRALTESRSAAVVSKMQREPEGAARLSQIDGGIAAAERRLQSLREEHGKARQRLAADRAQDGRMAAEAKPQRLAELHRERAGLAEMLTGAAHTFAAAMRAIEANREAIADLVPEQGTRNWFSVAGFSFRSNNAFARAFAVNPNGPLTQSNSLFGLVSHAVGAQVHWTLAEWEQPGLDDLLPFYLTEAEADAARERLELRNCPTLVVPLHGVFTLVRFEHVFGDEKSARRAATRATAPMAVVRQGDGFVLIPERFTGEAA